MNGEVVPNPAREGSAKCADAQGQEVLCCTWAPNSFAQGYAGGVGWELGGQGRRCMQSLYTSCQPTLAARPARLSTDACPTLPCPLPPHPPAALSMVGTLWTMLLANQIRVFVTSGAVAQVSGAAAQLLVRHATGGESRVVCRYVEACQQRH